LTFFIFGLCAVLNSAQIRANDLVDCRHHMAAVRLKLAFQDKEFDLEAPLAPVDSVIDAVAVQIERGGKFLMSFRKAAPLANLHGYLGGKLNPGESIAEAARREVKEEAGLDIENLEYLFVTIAYLKENGKTFRIFVIRAGVFHGEPQNLEPEKTHALLWVDPKALPGGLTSATQEDLKRLALIP